MAHFLVMGYWGCAAGWGHMFTTELSTFQAILKGLLEWLARFRNFESNKFICPKVTKMGSIIGHKMDQK